VDLREWNAKAFLKLSPSMASTAYVRRLRLIAHPSFWNASFRNASFLRQFEHLRSLAVAGLPMYIIRSPEAIFSTLNTFVRLHLDGVYFITFAQLARIICSFPRLNTLIITHVNWSEPDPLSAIISPPQSLRALEMRGCNWVVILQWFLSLDRIPTLRALLVHGSARYENDASTLYTFLQTLGPDLEELWLDPDVKKGAYSSCSFSDQFRLIPTPPCRKPTQH
jgi:hypothetical protein